MSSKFKAGDRVRCVEADNFCSEDRRVIYPTTHALAARVGDVFIVDRVHVGCEQFLALGGWWWNDHFELVQDEPTLTAAEEDFLVDRINHSLLIPPSDPVVRPNHYARYTIEPATFIAANKLPFDVGNVVKYVLRFDAKNGIEDLEKARRYIDMTIERLRREARVGDGEDASEVWRVML